MSEPKIGDIRVAVNGLGQYWVQDYNGIPMTSLVGWQDLKGPYGNEQLAIDEAERQVQARGKYELAVRRTQVWP